MARKVKRVVISFRPRPAATKTKQSSPSTSHPSPDASVQAFVELMSRHAAHRWSASPSIMLLSSRGSPYVVHTPQYHKTTLPRLPQCTRGIDLSTLAPRQGWGDARQAPLSVW